MSQTASSTSAYDAFPAQEFDAWIDRLRHTIIDGLEEPEVEVPPLSIPKLSESALEAVRQAELEAAEAEAEARARVEQERAEAEQELEKRRTQYLARLAHEQQQEEEQQEYIRQARARQEREAQRLEDLRHQDGEEERERLLADENAIYPTGAGQYDDENENGYMEDDDGDRDLQTGEVAHETEFTSWNREHQEVIDDSDDDGAGVQASPQTEYDTEVTEDTRKDDVFEYSDQEEEHQSQGSPQAGVEFDQSGPAEEEEFEEEFEEGPQSEGEDFSETAPEEASTHPTAFRRTYTSMQMQNAEQEMSGSEEGESQYDGDDHEINAQEIYRTSPPLAQEEREEDDQESEEGEPSTSRHPAQSTSRVSSSERSLGSEPDAIEVDGDSTEGESDNEGRQHNQSGSVESEGEGRLSPSGHYDDEESGSEDAAQGDHPEPSEAESDEENDAPPLAHLRQSQRPSEYDMDEQETGSGYGSDAQVDADRDDLQESYDDEEVETAGARDGIQEMSEDELAGDEEEDVTGSGGVAEPEYWLPTRTAQVASQWDPTSAIDPVLSGHNDLVETQEMVQISSHGLAIESLVQMAYSINAPRNQNDLDIFIDPHVSGQPITSMEHQEADLTGESTEVILESELYDQPSANEDVHQSDQQDEESGEVDVHRSVSPERGISPADLATGETASAHHDTPPGDSHQLSISPTRSPGAQEEDENMAEATDRSLQPTRSAVETVASYQSQTSPSIQQSDANEEPEETGVQDLSPIPAGIEEEHTAVTQSREEYNRDVEMAAEGDDLAQVSVEDTHGDQGDESAGSQGHSEQSSEIDTEDNARLPSAEQENPERNQGSPDFPLPEPEGYDSHAQDDQPSAATFDRDADFVRLTTPSNDEDDELEEGEIRDGDEDEAPAVRDDKGANQEGMEAESDSPDRHAGEADFNEYNAIVGVEVDLNLNLDEDLDLDMEAVVDVQAGVVETGKSIPGSIACDLVVFSLASFCGLDANEEPDVDSLGNTLDTESSDGIQRGATDVMGSREEGVRADEIANLEEDDEDSQQGPDYSADERESAESIQYGSDDAGPLPLRLSPEIDEVEPEDKQALIAEIRSHDRNDIPHKNEHLIEEDEEYDDDESEHHVDGRPAGYEDYEVVVEDTDPRDLEIFEVAERDHTGIEGDRTTEQVMIQEMALRQQPGDAVRAAEAVGAAQNITSQMAEERVMPRQPSINQIHEPANNTNESIDNSQDDITSDSEPRQPGNNAPELDLPGKSEPEVSDDFPPPVDEVTTQVEDDMFAVDSTPSAEVHANHDAIIDLLHSDALPPAPQDHRSPSPLVPEVELQHDIALMMEPAPLLHRRDQHHNVVLEESHRIHEEKLLSFTSAIAAVEKGTSSLSENNPTSQNPRVSNAADTDDIELDQPEKTSSDDAITEPQPSLPSPSQLGMAQTPLQAETADQEDDDDPLRLSGRFDDSEPMDPSDFPRTEVYVDLPILDRSQLHDTSLEPDVQIEIEQRIRPTTPLHSATSSIDPTRHHHGPVHRTSMSSVLIDDNDISGSPAAHTRSQCHYHKIRFGRGVFSHVLLIPHCSIGSEAARDRMGASDLGRVTKEEMLRKRDLNLGDTFTNKMTSDVETLPDDLEHHVRQLVGPDLLREGHIWLLPMADVAPPSMITRSLEAADSLGEDDVFHVRSSPRIAPRDSSQTPERKRKRGSSRARSTSTARSVVESPDSVSKENRSRPRAVVIRKVSQIDEKEEEAPESTGNDTPEQSNDIAENAPAEASTSSQHQGEAMDVIDDKEDLVTKGETSTPETADLDTGQTRAEKRSSLRDEDDTEDQDVDDRATKKRIIEREDGEGRDTIEVRQPVQKAGWLSWLFGKRP